MHELPEVVFSTRAKTLQMNELFMQIRMCLAVLRAHNVWIVSTLNSYTNNVFAIKNTHFYTDYYGTLAIFIFDPSMLLRLAWFLVWEITVMIWSYLTCIRWSSLNSVHYIF